MDTNALKRFAQTARQQLIAQVSTRVDQVLETDSALLREQEPAINSLKAEIKKRGKKEVIEEAAYTWFNRFCAFRFMDVNHYTPFGIVSPMPGFTQPEILQHAKEGLFETGWHVKNREMITGLLNRSIPSPDGDQEAYRLLLADACRHYANEMAFLFDDILDFTELLMPDDLLSSHSVLHATRETLTAETCQDVEVIGWLYQFYISEKKDEVMAQKGAVAKGDIPSVTQLFTPDWIVRYMVENSLGRLWLLNNPGSKIREQMRYYIQSEQAEEDFLVVESPEDLKLLDPACGSGHILTYAFDLLYEIYAEQGYDPIQIPRMIIEKNLYGIEIDKRAAMLASFALMMKARQKDARFFRRKVRPNVLEMEDIHFDPSELKDWRNQLGEDLWTQELWEGMQQFENAKTFGSLIRPAITNVPAIRQRMAETPVYKDLFLDKTSQKVSKILEMSEYLSQRYQVVVANPPYFSKGMDADYKKFAQDYFPDTKTDSFSMFVERNTELSLKGGQLGFMTPFVWMFIASYEKMRLFLIDQKTITSLIQLEYGGFEWAVVPICTFTIENSHKPDYLGGYIRLSEFKGADQQSPKTLEAIANPDCGWFYRSSAQDFKKIPGAPIAYWISDRFRDLFKSKQIGEKYSVGSGLSTSDNERFLRHIWEPSRKSIEFSITNCEETEGRSEKWYPFQKGGGFRKWFGNLEYVVNWKDNGKEIKEWVVNNPNDPDTSHWSRRIFNSNMYFKAGITWSTISSGKISFRLSEVGSMISNAAGGIFGFENKEEQINFLAALNTKIWTGILQLLNPTLNYSSGIISQTPLPDIIRTINNYEMLVDNSKQDWNSFETSWDFAILPLLKSGHYPVPSALHEKYDQLRKEWQAMTDETQRLEEENNRVFIEAYGLQDELTPEVPLDEITLTCNPHYRYKGNYTDEESEARLLQDTMKEFLSYAVGCMFGRYSLDKPGLILANQGESLKDYLKIIDKEPTFMPTENNVIPMLDDDYFADDITLRFREFLKVTFGETNFDENLRFIESALGKDLRSYFLRDFYRDHLQTYKKRPIYWLFSSAKGGFKALIYMHRYQADTVSVVLNQYLREYRQKLEAKRDYHEKDKENADLSKSERRRAEKESERIRLVLEELRDYEHDVLFPLAGKRLEIDLDDGVVVNHAKFGKALQKIR